MQNDLVEQAPHAVALFYTLILTHGYLQRLYDQTDADEVNVEVRFDSSQEGPAGEIIGSITMDREKVDAVDWNHIDPAYCFLTRLPSLTRPFDPRCTGSTNRAAIRSRKFRQ